MSREILYGVIGLVIGVLLTVFVAANAVNTHQTGMMQMMGIRSNTTQNGRGMMGNIDRTFIEQMIPHHEDAITMANLAQDKAQHEEIKTLSVNIKKGQSSEIEQMKSWYKDWYGEDVPQNNKVMGMHGMSSSSSTHMGMMGDDTDTETLEDASNFDKAFIEEMIPHHQMAVMMANMLLQSTNRPEMKQLAKNIINAQTKEINQMRQWYTDWGYAK
jgi:uncharacterized protein (DUF305 family)